MTPRTYTIVAGTTYLYDDAGTEILAIIDMSWWEDWDGDLYGLAAWFPCTDIDHESIRMIGTVTRDQIDQLTH